jgi:hypothetical protein
MTLGKNETKIKVTGDTKDLFKKLEEADKRIQETAKTANAAAEDIFVTIGKNFEKGFKGFPEKIQKQLKRVIDKTLELDFLKESSARALKGLEGSFDTSFEALKKTFKDQKFKDFDEILKTFMKSMKDPLKADRKTALSGFSAENVLAPFLDAGESAANDAGGILLKSIFDPLKVWGKTSCATRLTP